MSQFKLDEGDKIKPGFKTPPGYFEGFAERLTANIPVVEEPKVVPLYRSRPVWLSAAAVFIVLLGLGIFFRDLMPQRQAVQPDDESIEHYLVYQQGINSYDLMQSLDVQDIKEIETTDAISDEAIEEYLQSEDIYLAE